MQKTSASRKEVKTTESLDDEDEDDIGPIDWGDKVSSLTRASYRC